MLIRSITLLFLLLFTYNSHAQRLKLAIGFGGSLGTSKLLKKQMLTGETSVGYELGLSESFAISFSAGLTKISYDYSGASGDQIFNQRKFLNLGVEFIKYLRAPRPANSMFFGLGLIGDACVVEKEEIRNAGNLEIKKYGFPGYHLGVSGFAGFQTELSNTSTISFSLNAKIDLGTFYSNDLREVKFLKSLIGITYALKLSNKKT